MAQSCTVAPDFVGLHERIPEIVGSCVETASENQETGDKLQRTTGGLLVWRQASDSVAFTDGHRTWVLGPRGLQRRLNTEQFPWERGAGGRTGNAASARPGNAGDRSILAERRLVTYYGNPWSAQMGIVGELDKDELVSELRRVSQEYERLGGKPVQPAIHLIVTVAQASPGADGLYRLRMPDSMIEEYADLAAANGMLLVLDVQTGLSTVPAELEPFRSYLAMPHVHLALDPEFAMGPGQRPGVQLGSMDASAINYATRMLAGIAEANDLQNKVLIVHQFTASMITNKSAILNDPRVDVVIDMDGFGGPGIKTRHYNWYVGEEAVEFAGIKLFYRHDTNLMSPAEVLALDPPPDVVIYQ